MLPEDVIEAIDDEENIKMLATVDEQNNINMVPISSFRTIDDETIGYASCVDGTTKKNLETNGKASLVIFQPPVEGYQVKGRFIKWETSGEVYDIVAGSALKKLNDMGIAMKPEAVGIIKVTDAYALSLPMAGEKIA